MLLLIFLLEIMYNMIHPSYLLFHIANIIKHMKPTLAYRFNDYIIQMFTFVINLSNGLC